LCQHSSLDSPEWHESVLASREQERIAGKQQAMDWDTAKEQICQKIK
ncbi:TPA: addiction module antitoxin RelB, partial [Candidatus Poribacteria bacterium]|nr:addiction module antitoxin RelB [Candidatus Poribacteria bacterium]